MYLIREGSTLTKPGPGKFEGNPSLEASEILLEHTLDGVHETLGEAHAGWLGAFTLIRGEAISEKDKAILPDAAYICEEDGYGFFAYKAFASLHQALIVWNDLEQKLLYQMEDV